MAQDGSLYAVGDTCYLKYYIIVDGKRKHKTVQLCKRDDVRYWREKRGKWSFSSGVRELQRETMDKIKADAKAAEVAALALTQKGTPGEMRVVDFWDTKYLPYIEAVLPLTGQPRRKPSTIRGFKQIWKQHLKAHFGATALKDYEPAMGKRFLRSLTSTQGKTTLKHIKALAGSLFGYAVDEEFIKVNPWHDVKIPEDAIESAATAHYTLPEVETIVSSLVDHVDAQLVITLACFLGLRPGEIAALKWEDFDDETVSIRRSVVRGVVGTPKTPESLAPLPLLAQVKIPLKLWWEKSGKPTEGWVFPSESTKIKDTKTPVDLHNLVARVIKPHVEGPAYQIKGAAVKCIRCNKVPKASGAQWKTVYAGRRCAATAVIEANNGNLAIGQALLRHKNQMTTATFYKKAVTPETLRNGMKMLEAAATGESKKQA
jgi:integrase